MIKIETIWEVNLFLILTLLALEVNIYLAFILASCAFASFMENMSIIKNFYFHFIHNNNTGGPE